MTFHDTDVNGWMRCILRMQFIPSPSLRRPGYEATETLFYTHAVVDCIIHAHYYVFTDSASSSLNGGSTSLIAIAVTVLFPPKRKQGGGSGNSSI